MSHAGEGMGQTHKQVGSTSWNVQECRVWAEINYLDSTTDYREYLPQHTPLQMLDDRMTPDNQNHRSSRWKAPFVPVIGISLLAAAGFVLFLLIDRL